MSNQLEIYPIQNSILSDAIDRIVVKLHGENNKDDSKIFLCTGAGANGGTTTIAINIAIALACAGWKTIFVDCDFRKSQIYKRVEQKETASLAEYLTDEIHDYQKVILPTNVQNLDYILSGKKNDNPIRLLSNIHMKSLFENLKDNYDFVIVDTPPISITNDAEILIPLIDKYFFVVCMNETTKKQLVSSRLQLADYEEKYMGIVANKIDLGQYRDEFRDYDYFSKSNLLKKQKKGMNKKRGLDNDKK